MRRVDPVCRRTPVVDRPWPMMGRGTTATQSGAGGDHFKEKKSGIGKRDCWTGWEPKMPDVSRLASACPDDAASPRRPIREGRKEFFPETASQGTVCLPPATALPLPLLPCGTDASARQRRCGLGCGEIGGGCLPRQTAGGTLAVRSGCVSSHWMGYWGERETAKGREKEKKRKNETACSSSRYRARRLGEGTVPLRGSRKTCGQAAAPRCWHYYRGGHAVPAAAALVCAGRTRSPLLGFPLVSTEHLIYSFPCC